MRVLALFAAASLLAQAPLQCARDEPAELRRYETPPEALHELAERFRAEGNEAARRETLEFLLERYPNSRYARQARQELGLDPRGPTSAPSTPSAPSAP